MRPQVLEDHEYVRKRGAVLVLHIASTPLTSSWSCKHSLCLIREHPSAEQRTSSSAPPRPAALTHTSSCKRARTGPRAPAHPATPPRNQLNQVPRPEAPSRRPGTPLVSLSLACAHARARTHSPRPRTGRGRRPPGAGSQEQSRGSIPRLASPRKLRAGPRLQILTSWRWKQFTPLPPPPPRDPCTSPLAVCSSQEQTRRKSEPPVAARSGFPTPRPQQAGGLEAGFPRDSGLGSLLVPHPGSR